MLNSWFNVNSLITIVLTSQWPNRVYVNILKGLKPRWSYTVLVLKQNYNVSERAIIFPLISMTCELYAGIAGK